MPWRFLLPGHYYFLQEVRKIIREDPVVFEMRQIREQMLKKVGSLENLVEKRQETQKQHGSLLVKTPLLRAIAQDIKYTKKLSQAYSDAGKDDEIFAERFASISAEADKLIFEQDDWDELR